MEMESVIRKKYEPLAPLLDEHTRRLWAATEANALGYGGISIISRATGISRRAILVGINEIKQGIVLTEGRVRKQGGGRKSQVHHQPDLMLKLESLVEPLTRGDPESPLRWTLKSTRSLSKELEESGYTASSRLVAALLLQMGHSLQGLADELRFPVSVSHFPPGTSKWNKVEHRLFSFISSNRRGEPLKDYETIVNLISNTVTSKGLEVNCQLDQHMYPTGTVVSDEEWKSIRLFPNAFHGDWNYTIRPRKNK